MPATASTGPTTPRIEAAVDAVLERGLRTPDLAGDGEAAVGTEEMTEAVLGELSA